MTAAKDKDKDDAQSTKEARVDPLYWPEMSQASTSFRDDNGYQVSYKTDEKGVLDDYDPAHRERLEQAGYTRTKPTKPVEFESVGGTDDEDT